MPKITMFMMVKINTFISVKTVDVFIGGKNDDGRYFHRNNEMGFYGTWFNLCYSFYINFNYIK